MNGKVGAKYNIPIRIPTRYVAINPLKGHLYKVWGPQINLLRPELAPSKRNAASLRPYAGGWGSLDSFQEHHSFPMKLMQSKGQETQDYTTLHSIPKHSPRFLKVPYVFNHSTRRVPAFTPALALEGRCSGRCLWARLAEYGAIRSSP